MHTTVEYARRFRELHDGPEPLILANAWDAGSGRLIESMGAKAVASTSAGVAWSHGFADGDLLPPELLAATVAEIARAIRVPLSIDIESGYSQDPETVAGIVARIVDAGAVGINIEDGAGTPDLLCKKIEWVKQVSSQRGVDLFVNARTDVYLREQVPQAERVAETIARAKRYRSAGADGLFVPKVVDPNEIRMLAEAVRLPLNVLAWPGLPSAADLAQLGVRRLSAGSALAQVVWGRAATLVGRFLVEGRSDQLLEGVMPYAQINALVAGR